MKTLLLFSVCALVGGCVTAPPPPDLSASHPANPQAAQGNFAPAKQSLLSVTNLISTKPTSEPEAEHHHEHESHSK